MYINNTDANAVDLSAFLDSFDNNSRFGSIRVSKKNDSSVFWMGRVTAEVDSGLEHVVTVGHIVSNGTFTDTDALVVSFAAHGSPVGYQVYTATISQTGTADPVATVLGGNDIGNIVWTRGAASSYIGTLAGAFSPLPNVWLYVRSGIANGIEAQLSHNNVDSVILQNYISGIAADIMDKTSIEIRVYS